MVLLTASAADATGDPATDRTDPTRPAGTRGPDGSRAGSPPGARPTTGPPAARPARRRRSLAVLVGPVGRVVVVLGIVGAVLMVAAPSAPAVVLGPVGAHGAAVLVVIVVLAVYVVVAAEQRVPRGSRGDRRDPGGAFDAVSRLPFSFDRCQDPGALRSVLARFVTEDTLVDITERIRTAVTTRPVTVSAGAAAFPDHGRVPADLIQAADRALYRAKRSGRNRTCTATVPAVSAAGVDDGVDARGTCSIRGDARPVHGDG